MTNEEISAFSYRIMQASPTQLVVILYEMGIVYLKDAVTYIDGEHKDEARTSLKNARRVVDELNHSLNMEYEISVNLMQIYMSVNRAIIRASVSLRTDELIRCIGMLEKLRKSFEDISSHDTQGAVMKNSQQVYAGLTYGKGTLNESFGLESNRGFRV